MLSILCTKKLKFVSLKLPSRKGAVHGARSKWKNNKYPFHRALDSSDPFLSSISSQKQFKSFLYQKKQLRSWRHPLLKQGYHPHFELEQSLDFELNTDDEWNKKRIKNAIVEYLD